MGGGKFCSSGFCAARHSNFARDPSWTYNCSKVLFEPESPSYIWKMWYKIKISKTYLTNQYVSSNMGMRAFVILIVSGIWKKFPTITYFVFLLVSHWQELSSFQCFLFLANYHILEQSFVKLWYIRHDSTNRHIKCTNCYQGNLS